RFLFFGWLFCCFFCCCLLCCGFCCWLGLLCFPFDFADCPDPDDFDPGFPVLFDSGFRDALLPCLFGRDPASFLAGSGVAWAFFSSFIFASSFFLVSAVMVDIWFDTSTFISLKY